MFCPSIFQSNELFESGNGDISEEVKLMQISPLKMKSE